eukprot:TRINITY_DN70536_c0_g1_i1.p1 TRINITY_DN70536_c0_g1~~TRINITY_DN70536_c0_g1_i1.p1  ORF type:complete len:412 (+),score=74.59 TRINITY_DN70536_c0_g1_i1:86-1321(+)
MLRLLVLAALCAWTRAGPLDFVVLSDVRGRYKNAAIRLIEHPAVASACPSCEPLPRRFAETCQLLEARAPVLPWFLSLVQLPQNFLGNYLMNMFFAWAVTVAAGVPFVVLTTELEEEGFEAAMPYLLHFSRSLPSKVDERLPHLAKVACKRCGFDWAHECSAANGLWQRFAARFAGHFRQALNATVLRLWSGIGWPADERTRLHHDVRRVAVHMRCGDALAQEKASDWGLLPLSSYSDVLRKNDVVAILSSSSRASDLPYAKVCSEVVLGLAQRLQQRLGVRVVPFIDNDLGHDLAVLAFADVVICPVSTLCFWGAMAAAAPGGRRGKHDFEAYVPAGRVFMNGSMPRLPLTWVPVPRLAKGDATATVKEAAAASGGDAQQSIDNDDVGSPSSQLAARAASDLLSVMEAEM